MLSEREQRSEMQIRKLAAVVLALVAAACGGTEGGAADAPADGSAPSRTYSDNGVTFEYPEGWEEFPAEASATAAGSSELWSATVGPDKTNLVNLTAYRLNVAVTEENLTSIEAELDGVIQGVVKQAGGTITSGPTAEEVAGFPAYTYMWEDVEVDGEPKDSAAYFLFDDKKEYFFNCQFSEQTQDEVQAGCEQILDSFVVTHSV